MKTHGALLLLLLAGGPAWLGAQTVQTTTTRPDSSTAVIPVGKGTLKQDVIAIRMSVGALDIRFTPLEDPLLLLLAPDAYQALSALVATQKFRIDSVAAAHGIQRPGIALVSFYSATPNTRFDPRQLTVILQSRRLQPVGSVALNAGFSNQQLVAREQATGIVIFERPIPATETFSLGYLTTVNRDWETVLPRLTTERSRILNLIKPDTMETKRP